MYWNRKQLWLTAAGWAVLAAVPLAAQNAITPFPATQMNFVFQTGQSVPPGQQLDVSSVTPGTTVNVAKSSGADWLSINVLAGLSPFQVVVSVAPIGLSPGTYTANLVLSSTGLASVTVPVQLTVSGSPLIATGASAMRFSLTQGGTAPAQNLAVTTTSGSLSFNAAALVISPGGGTWLSVSPATGTATTAISQLQVAVSGTGLSPGTYSGQVTIASAGAANPTVIVPVVLTVTGAVTLDVKPAAVSFEYYVGGPALFARTVSIGVSGGSPATFTATAAVTTPASGAWLRVNGTNVISGTTPGNLSLSVDTTGLPPGTYSGTLTVTATGLATATVNVTLRVSTDPIFSAVPGALSFQHQIQVASSAPVPKTVVLSNLGPATPFQVTTQLTSGTGWLNVTPTSSTAPAALLVSVNPSGLAPGVYAGKVAINSAGTGSNPVVEIPVSLAVSAAPLLRLDRQALTFNYRPSGAAPASRPILVTSTSTAIDFTATAATSNGTNWLRVAPTGSTGTGGASLAVSIDTSVPLPPGQYTGTVSVTGSFAGSPTETVAVTLNVSDSALLDADGAPLDFTFNTGGTQPANKQLPVASTGAAIAFTTSTVITSGATAWLLADPPATTTGNSVTVGVRTTGLPAGIYTGLVTLTASAASNSPQYVPVVLTIRSISELRTAPAQLTFQQNVGGTPPAAQTLNITSTNTVLNFTVTPQVGQNWLSVDAPASGLTPGSVTVRVNGSTLASGTYASFVSVQSTSLDVTNSPLLVPVTLRVGAPINASPASLAFSFQAGGATPQPQTIQLTAATPLGISVSSSVSSGSGWLSVTSSSTTTPATLNVSVQPASLAGGTYQGEIVVTSADATNSPLRLPVTLTVTFPVGGNLIAFRNGASFQATPVVPGMLFSVFGTNLGPAQGRVVSQEDLTPQGNLPKVLGNVRVRFDGIEAPLLYVGAGQINGVVPYEIAPRVSSRIEVEYLGVRSNSIELRVGETAPALFTQNSQGNGPASIVNQNGTLNGPGNAADIGSIVLLYATGEGVTTPAGIDGFIPRTADQLRRPVRPVSVRIGGVDAPVEYQGSAPFLVLGTMQINVRIPQGVTPGPAVPIEITGGGATSPPGTTISIR